MNRAYTETPVSFGDERSLLGVLCRPTVASAAPFVVLLNAGIIHSPGPNRMNAHLARALARIGASSLRFDQSGIGDSVVPTVAAAASVRERVQADIDAALAFARAHAAATRFVVGGLCSGADNAVRTAARRDDVCGVLTIDLNVAPTRGHWMRHYARRVLRLRSWRAVAAGRHAAMRRLRTLVRGSVESPSQPRDAPTEQALAHDDVIPLPEMRAMLHRLVNREVALLCVFSGGIEKSYSYERQFLDRFPDVAFGTRLQLEFIPEADHTFTGAAMQEWLCGHVVSWVSETAMRADAAQSS